MEQIDSSGALNVLASSTIPAGTRAATLPFTLIAGFLAKRSMAVAALVAALPMEWFSRPIDSQKPHPCPVRSFPAGWSSLFTPLAMRSRPPGIRNGDGTWVSQSRLTLFAKWSLKSQVQTLPEPQGHRWRKWHLQA